MVKMDQRVALMCRFESDQNLNHGWPKDQKKKIIGKEFMIQGLL